MWLLPSDDFELRACQLAQINKELEAKLVQTQPALVQQLSVAAREEEETDHMAGAHIELAISFISKTPEC